MWILMPTGFFSVVRKPGDELLTVRARSRADLERLAASVPALGPIEAGGGTDYPYRARIGTDDLAEAVAAAVRGIDYSNFKDAVARRAGTRRAKLYGKVWQTLLEIENEEVPR